MTTACFRPDTISLPPLEPIVGADSRTLFVDDPVLAPGLTAIIDLRRDPDEAGPLAVSPEASFELWRHSCERELLRAPRSGALLPRLTAEEATRDCRDVGAPCPIEALRLGANREEWSAVTSPAQPWGNEGRPSECAAFGPAIDLVLTADAGRAQFEAAIGQEALLLSSNPGREFRLDVWSLPPGPLPDPSAGLAWVASSTGTDIKWLGALSLPDRRVVMVASDGATAIVALQGGRLAFEPGESLPPSVLACTSSSGTILAPSEFGLGGGMTEAGFETWVVTDCGGLASRIEQGPWREVRRAGEPIRRQPTLVWVGPGEVYAARALRAGLLHARNGQVSEEQFDQLPPALAVGRGPGGRVFASIDDRGFGGSEIHALVDGVWVRWGPREATHVPSFLPLERTLLVATGDPRQTAQLGERSLCDDELHPYRRPKYLVSRLTEVNGHIVAALFLPSSSQGADESVRWTVFDPILPTLCDQPR